MTMVNPNENLIRITPPIPWSEIQTGPALAALEMEFNRLAISGLEVGDVATGIRLARGGRTDGWLESELQKVIDHYDTHAFDGHIEIRHARPQGTLAERVVVRGRKVVRVEAVLGWPSEPDTDPAEESLMDILASVGDGGAYVNLCAGDFDRPEMRPADETDLPDLLLAWKNAAVREALAAQLVTPGSGEYPGSPGTVWHDADGEAWMLCDDGRMRLRDRGPGVDPGEIARIYGPMTPAGDI